MRPTSRGSTPTIWRENQAAKAVHQAKEAEQQALEAHYLPADPSMWPPKAASKAEWEAERTLRRKREREASEAVLKAQRARQAELKAQRECNSKLAAVAYQARAISPDYTAPTAHDIARHFHLSHIAGALCPPMSDILEALFRGRPLTDDELSHLKNKAPDDLYRLASGQLTFDAYIGPARAAAAEFAARKASEEAAEAARIARESDPEYIAMMQQQSLYRKYGVSLTDKSLMPRMTKLLQLIDAGKRLPQDELVWLSTEARSFHEATSGGLSSSRSRIPCRPVSAYRDPWNVINASGHYRKCRRAETALELLDSLALDRLKHPKVRSAVLTTHGGVMRDLNRRPKQFRWVRRRTPLCLETTAHALCLAPCTWSSASLNVVAHGMKKRASAARPKEHRFRTAKHLSTPGCGRREAMKRFLLAEDPHRYRWLNLSIRSLPTKSRLSTAPCRLWIAQEPRPMSATVCARSRSRVASGIAWASRLGPMTSCFAPSSSAPAGC
jgi:hypothetical protein